MDSVMHCTQRSAPTIVSGKHLLAGGFIAAALMAGGVAGAACAAASPADAGADTSQTSASSAGSTTEATDRPDTSTKSDDRDSGDRGRDTESQDSEDADAAESAPRDSTADADAADVAPEDTRPVRHERTRRAERIRTAVADTSEPVVRRSARRTPPEPAPAAAKAATTTLAAAPAATATATATASDPVLVAAATSTRVTVGSMIVDSLYSMGIRSSRMGTTWLDIPVSQATADRWLVKRKRIYRDVVVSTPSQPRLLWETNFSSREEALKYWGMQTGRWGQSAGENQYYTDGNNITVDADGNLVITARREPAPDGLGAPYNYTSARVVTYGKQSIGVGTRVEARIKMPVDKGVLPAFWSVGLEPGHEFDWPRQGEIDIAEVPGFGTPEAARMWTGNIHGPSKANNTVDVKLNGVDADLGVDLSADYHVYGMDWYADRITWRVDGVEVGSVTKAQYEALGGDWTPFSGQWQHYLILNVAVGNPWTGDPSASAPLNAEMKVDWVRAYQL
ncbi:glycoside hydrolase family 16 protein [Mycolicibacterium chubuense]|nr:glycoside hydrolase family 16 protein [Mycolicibacterium chubuense]